MIPLNHSGFLPLITLQNMGLSNEIHAKGRLVMEHAGNDSAAAVKQRNDGEKWSGVVKYANNRVRWRNASQTVESWYGSEDQWRRSKRRDDLMKTEETNTKC